MAPIIELRQLTKYFGGLPAVKTLDLQVEEHELLGLIGPNGAGKTTVFNLIAGALRPTSGELWFRQKRIDGLRPDKICKLGIARTFQVVKPFGEATVFDNVMVGALCHISNLAEAKKRTYEVLDLIGLSGSAYKVAKSLTLGDRKRLEFARALATQPPVLLLDEVMAGLTPTEANTMVALIRSLWEQGLTIIVIEHNMPAVMSLAKKILVLDHGEQIAYGDPKDVAKNPNVIKAYLGGEAC